MGKEGSRKHETFLETYIFFYASELINNQTRRIDVFLNSWLKLRKFSSVKKSSSLSLSKFMFLRPV